LGFYPRWRKILFLQAVATADAMAKTEFYAPITEKVIVVFPPITQHLCQGRQLSIIFFINLTASITLINGVKASN